MPYSSPILLGSSLLTASNLSTIVNIRYTTFGTHVSGAKRHFTDTPRQVRRPRDARTTQHCSFRHSRCPPSTVTTSSFSRHCGPDIPNLFRDFLVSCCTLRSVFELPPSQVDQQFRCHIYRWSFTHLNCFPVLLFSFTALFPISSMRW
jgi:hypothetical protein